MVNQYLLTFLLDCNNYGGKSKSLREKKIVDFNFTNLDIQWAGYSLPNDIFQLQHVTCIDGGLLDGGGSWVIRLECMYDSGYGSYYRKYDKKHICYFVMALSRMWERQRAAGKETETVKKTHYKGWFSADSVIVASVDAPRITKIALPSTIRRPRPTLLTQGITGTKAQIRSWVDFDYYSNSIDLLSLAPQVYIPMLS